MPTSPAGICRQGKGFTFLELLVAIFIISLLAAVVFPSLSGIGENQIRSDARKIAALLRYLNDTAIARKEQNSLEIDFRRNSLSWKGPDGEKADQFKTLSSLHIPSRGRVNDGSVTFFFGPLGAAEPIEFALQDSRDRMRVAFNPLSGRVRIADHE